MVREQVCTNCFKLEQISTLKKTLNWCKGSSVKRSQPAGAVAFFMN
jgi:hypothetical protein